MSNQHGKPPATIRQFLIATLGGLFAPALVIYLIVKLVVGFHDGHAKDTDPAASQTAVLERIKPVGEVSLKDTSGPQTGKSGEQVVNEICIACHGTGALGAPKIGDSAAWAPRISQGYDTLIKHALQGLRSMPPRGGAADLSDDEIAGAVAYMANKAGANFKAPQPKAAAAPPRPPPPAPAPSTPQN